MIDEAAVARARAQTPGCGGVVHLDAAGSALPPWEVTAAVVDHLRLEEQVGGYRAADLAATRYAAAYESLASLLGCSTDELALTDSATRSWHLAVHALPLGPGDRIAVSSREYASHTIGLRLLAEQRGFEVSVVPEAPDGTIELDALARSLDGRVGLVALTHVPSNDGMVNRAREVGRLARAAGVPFLLDASQSIGQMPIRVDDVGCDILVAPGRKFLRGPRGTGLLYVRSSLLGRLRPTMLDLVGASVNAGGAVVPRPGARRFEGFERSVALGLGLGTAVDVARAWGLDAIAARVRALATRLRGEFAARPSLRVCDGEGERSAIVTFVVDGLDCDEVRRRLADRGVIVSTTGRYGPDGRPGRPSRVLRASPHYFNTEDELDRLVTEIDVMAPC